MSPIKIGDEPPRDSHPIVDVFNAAVNALDEMHQHQDDDVVADGEPAATVEQPDQPGASLPGGPNDVPD
jgi:hypothetical protein